MLYGLHALCGRASERDQVFRDQELRGRTRMLIFFSEGRGFPNLDKRLLRRLIDQFRDFFRTVVGWQPRQRLAQIHERRTIIRTPEKPDSPRLVAGWITWLHHDLVITSH